MSLAGRILFEDNHLIIINKLAGEIVQGDKTGDIPLVEEVRQYLKERYNKPGNVFCGLVHRIDRPVSGAVIFAKTSKALARMNEMVKERNISKTYLALVEKTPDIAEQKLVDYVKKDERTNKTAVSPTPKDGYVVAELAYRVLTLKQSAIILPERQTFNVKGIDIWRVMSHSERLRRKREYRRRQCLWS